VVRTFLAYAACVAIWGTTWLGIKLSLLGFPPVLGAGLRFVLAGLVLYACAFATRVDLRRHAPPLHLVLVLAATMFGFNYALTYAAETHLASGLVAVLYGTMPFFVYGFASVVLRERVSLAGVAGAVLALAGVALVSLSGSVGGDAIFVAITLVAAGLSGFANVYLKRHAASEPLATLPPAMLLAGIAMTIWGAAFEPVAWSGVDQVRPIAALVYLAVFGSALAFYLNHWLLQRISSGAMGLSALLIPVVAVAVGALFGGETFTARALAGALTVVVGVAISLGGERSSVEPATEPHPAI